MFSCGLSHSLVLSPTGDVFLTGEMYSSNTFNLSEYPVKIENLPPIAAVSAGNRFSLCVDYDGNVWVNGQSLYGETGLQPSNNDWNMIPNLVNIKTVSASHNNYSLFLDADGCVWGTGFNLYGQLGLGLCEWQKPAKILNIPKIKAISTGYYHSLLLDESGTVWSCGYNLYGQLGRKSEHIELLDRVDIGVEVVSISAGNYHSVFLDVDGNVWGCGHNINGALGLPHRQDVIEPEKVQALSEIKSIAAGRQTTKFIDKELNVWACGTMRIGQAGHALHKINLIKDIIFVDCSAHVLYLDIHGNIWVQGDNDKCQLGIGQPVFPGFHAEPTKNERFPLLRGNQTKSARNL